MPVPGYGAGYLLELTVGVGRPTWVGSHMQIYFPILINVRLD